jgi:hypothetical protein
VSEGVGDFWGNIGNVNEINTSKNKLKKKKSSGTPQKVVCRDECGPQKLTASGTG